MNKKDARTFSIAFGLFVPSWMTQHERALVWARKDELRKALSQLPSTDKRNREHIQEQIETCNQALVQNKFELMPKNEE